MDDDFVQGNGMRAQKPIQSGGKRCSICQDSRSNASINFAKHAGTGCGRCYGPTSNEGTAQTVEILCVVSAATGSTISHASTRSNISSPGDVRR